MNVRPFSTSDAQLLARNKADAGEPCEHPWEPESELARVFEQAYAERLRQQQQLQRREA